LASTTEVRIEAYLRSVGVSEPVRPFIKRVSNLYHKHEAAQYDAVHDEIRETEPAWADCLGAIAGALPESVTVLDLGSGTGFAAEQAVRALGPRIERLVCQDLSAEMLKVGRSRLSRLTDRASFVAGEAGALLGGSRGFDLVLTNAVLHHLLDLEEFLGMVGRLVRPGGFYVAGHEPSDAFFANPRLYRWTQLYRRWRQLRKLASPAFYFRRLGAGPAPRSVEELTNEDLVRAGVIREPFPDGVVRHLVDIHVPPGSESLRFWGEPGFNAPSLCRKYLPDFEVYHLATYPHIKEARARMGPLWRGIDRALARAHPGSGANFLMAARKADAPAEAARS
jgi:ubiquinone/menaquinone biosynthesis C-methylase UbiE